MEQRGVLETDPEQQALHLSPGQCCITGTLQLGRVVRMQCHLVCCPVMDCGMQAGESIIGKMLSHAEALAATAEGAAVMWRDAGRLAAVRDILRRPASGIAYTQVRSSKPPGMHLLSS